MSEGDFDELRSHVISTCYCTEFSKGAAAGCPELKLECWRHPKMVHDCDACILCDYLNPLGDHKVWKMYLSKIKCNLQKCEHEWVAHSCTECPCICGECIKDCICSECIPEYQEMPVINSDSDLSDYKLPDKVYIPYPDDLLEDAIDISK